MMRKICLIFLCLTLDVFPVHAASLCTQNKTIVSIGNELRQLLHPVVCKNGFDAKKISWLKEKLLPQIMDKDFLGVEPPQNWQFLINSLMNTCYHEQNICLQEEQKKFIRCTKDESPIVIMVFTAWYYQNCDIINNNLVEKWQWKKDAIIRFFSKSPSVNNQ